MPKYIDQDMLRMFYQFLESLLAVRLGHSLRRGAGENPRGRLPNCPEQHECRRLIQLKNKRVAHDSHGHVLKELWETFYPDEQYTGPNTLWTKAGFQQKDPVSDIRGGGELALRNLLYVMQTNPSLYHEVHSRLKNEDIDHFYPFAVAGINITIMLASVFEIVRPFGGAGDFGSTRLQYWNHLESFDELYCIVLELVEQEYVHTHATYMQFNSVLEKCKQRLLSALRTEGATLADMRASLEIKAREPPTIAEHRSVTCSAKRSRQKKGKAKRDKVTKWQCKTADLLGLDCEGEGRADGTAAVQYQPDWGAVYSNDGHLMVPNDNAFWEAFGLHPNSQQHSQLSEEQLVSSTSDLLGLVDCAITKTKSIRATKSTSHRGCGADESRVAGGAMWGGEDARFLEAFGMESMPAAQVA
jgi:hypothetical protein